MGPRTTARVFRVVASAVLVAALALVPGVAAASGGGGCGGAVTDGSGRDVAIESFCFTPTILRVEPGEVVTFTNRDRAPHSVLGANGSWGNYESMRRGHEVLYRFSSPGVYAYVCTVHIGMVGVVVVGDGVGGAFDETTEDGPVTKVTSATADLQVQPAVRLVDENDGGARWPAVTIAGVAFAGTGALVLRRRRRRSAS